MEPDDLMTVYTTDDANLAELLASVLHAEGIKCEIDGESQAGFAGVPAMEIKLVVRAEDHDRARAFIESHEKS